MSEASQRVSDRGIGSKPKRLRSGSLQADLSSMNGKMHRLLIQGKLRILFFTLCEADPQVPLEEEEA